MNLLIFTKEIGTTFVVEIFAPPVQELDFPWGMGLLPALLWATEGGILILIRRENGAFRKRSWNRRNLTTLALRFRLERKLFENEAFRKREGLIIMWFSWSSCTQTLIQNDRWLLHLNFFSVVGWPEFFLCAAFPEAKSVRPPEEA